MKRFVLALLWLLGTAPFLPSYAQGVPNTAQVTSSCGSTPGTYSPGINYPILQNTAGQGCVSAAISGTVPITPQTAIAPTVSASASVTSLVLKSSATTLGVQYFHAENITNVTGYCVLYNGSSAPSTGALTAANVLAFQLLPPNGFCDWGSRWTPPIAATTGAVVLLTSATTPFTYTTGSITGAIYGLAQ